MTLPDHLAHDPERCVTCSGNRHRPEPNPLADELSNLLDVLAILPDGGPEPEPNGRWG